MQRTSPHSPPLHDQAPLIEVDGLGKSYHVYAQPQHRLWQTILRGRKQFFREFWALRDVSFAVRRGESVGIIGRNGSGKSTLLQLVAGTLSPTTGTVAVRGRVAALLELGSGFSPEFSGRENVVLNATILGMSTNDLEDRFDEIVDFAGLREFIDQPVKTYSSGMVMRLAFAVAVNVRPDVLIVDEALAVGDAAFQLRCLDRMERMLGDGVTLLFVSHDVGLVRTFCAEAIYLDHGRVAGHGPVGPVTEQYFRDIRAEQRRSVGGPDVIAGAPIGPAGGTAFGTGEAQIVAAGFLKSRCSEDVVERGEPVAFEVACRWRDHVERPALVVVIQDRLNRELGIASFPLEGQADPAGFGRMARLCIQMPGRFGTGRFFVTLRVDARRSEHVSFPLAKQFAALSFEVAGDPRLPNIGNVDLGITLAARESV